MTRNADLSYEVATQRVPIDLSHFVGGLLLLGIEWRDRR